MSILLIGALAALICALLLAAVTVFSARPAQDGVTRALAAIENTYAAGATSTLAEATSRTDALPSWLRSLAVRLSPQGIGDKLQRRLDLAGNPRAWTPDRILAAKGLGLFAFAGLGALYGMSFSASWLIVGAAVGTTFGFFLPDLLLFNAGQKRQEKIRKALPDALDMLTVCAEAGLGFDASLAQVARNTTGPLAMEFARALQEMQIGKSRTEALHALSRRSSVPELRSFVSALVQASELGIALAAVLREQARELRVRRRQRAEERAQKVPVKILFPLIFCIFPAMFVVVLGPAVITIATTMFK